MNHASRGARGAAIALTLGALAAGCTYDAEIGSASAASNTPIELDVLFVVDDSGSMAEEQASLAANFAALIDELENLPGGLPSVHIGVVSTDVGTGPFSYPGCQQDGDDGALQDDPMVTGCTPPTDPFIADIVQADGTRAANYTGDLDAAFQCIGLLGTSGCGFEQPLESMMRALDSTGAGEPNDGFLRQDAYLAVIVVADEDDCSAEDTDVFDPSSTTVNDPLGPIRSFRCVEYGVRCDNMSVSRTPDTYAACEPRGDTFLYHTDIFSIYLESLKSSAGQVFVGVIAGDTGPLEVTLDGEGAPQVEPSCTSASGVAFPAYRLRAFAEAFPNNAVTSICDPNLDLPVMTVAQNLRRAIEAGEAGIEPEPEAGDGGCRTSTGGSLATALLAALGLALVRRRRA